MLGFPVKGDEKHEYNITKILIKAEENVEASRALLPGNLDDEFDVCLIVVGSYFFHTAN